MSRIIRPNGIPAFPRVVRRPGCPSLAVLCLLAAAPAVLSASGAGLPPPPPAGGPWAGFDVRYGIPAGTDLAGLVERPALISMDTLQFKAEDSGENRISGFGEAHGVFPVPLAKLASVLEDRAGQKAWSNRLISVSVDEREGKKQVVTEDIGIRFLGMTVGYKVRSEFLRDELSPTALGFRARMVESMDGSLFESFSSWYLEEVAVRGQRMTYFRIYSRPGIRNPFPGMATIIRTFTPRELSSTLNAAAAEAQKR